MRREREDAENDKLLTSEVEIPIWWRTRPEEIQADLMTVVQDGKCTVLTTSAGGREIIQVSFGEREEALRGTANFNSAIGSGSEDAYIRKGDRKFPVLMMLAGVHGHEVEGMVAAMQLIKIYEQGIDLLGRVQADLQRQLRKLRIVVFPLLNPDGRLRSPYDGWSGLPQEEMTRYGQGTKKNGESYRWQPSKAVHPMQGDVGWLGAYFDDNGINLMHDEWFRPYSRTTSALLQTVAEEGPDLLLNLHSYQLDPGMLKTAFVPQVTKQRLQHFTENDVYPAIERYGMRTNSVPVAGEDGETVEGIPPFNLTSICYHLGATLPCTFESPHGILENPYSYEQIHDLHLGLLEASVAYLLQVSKQ